MDVYEAMKTRRSIRAFAPRAVEDEKLERILEAVRLAPSARNVQEWRFVIVRDRAVRERLAFEAAAQPFMAQASVLIACCAETDGRIMRCGQPAYVIDVAIAVDHLTLAAVREGLGTCWIGSFDEGMVKRILGIPSAIRVVQLMPLGYPLGDDSGDAGMPLVAEKKRLRLAEIIHNERW
jgi:nitroreductase